MRTPARPPRRPSPRARQARGERLLAEHGPVPALDRRRRRGGGAPRSRCTRRPRRSRRAPRPRCAQTVEPLAAANAGRPLRIGVVHPGPFDPARRTAGSSSSGRWRSARRRGSPPASGRVAVTPQRPSCSRETDPVGDGVGLVAVVGHVQRRRCPAPCSRRPEVERRGGRGARGRARRAARPAGAGGATARAPAPAPPVAPRRRRARPRPRRSKPGSPTSVEQLGHPPADLGLGSPGHRQPEADVAGDVAVGEELVVLEDQPEATAVGGNGRAGLRRPTPRGRASGTSRPAITRSSVLLPDPLGPSSPTTSPAATVRSSLVEHDPVAEADRHPVDLEHRTARVPRSPPRRRGGDRRRGSRRRSPPSAWWPARTTGHVGRARAPEQPGDGDRHRLVADPGEERGRAELAERDGEGEAGPGHERAGAGTAGRSPARPGAGEAPSVAAASRRRGSIERSVGRTARTTNGHGDDGVGDGDEDPRAPQVERRRSMVISKPKPTVTAEVPRGSIRPASRSEPPRR